MKAGVLVTLGLVATAWVLVRAGVVHSVQVSIPVLTMEMGLSNQAVIGKVELV